MIPVALSIAGSDPSGGAGLQADLKVFHQFKVYGMSVITLLTIQNTLGIKEVLVIDADKVLAQLDTLLEDITPQAIKTGALGNAKIISGLMERAKNFTGPLIIDPVIVSKNKTPLIDTAGCDTLKSFLRYATLVTPNIPEAEFLSGITIEDYSSMEKAAHKIAEFGPKAVLIKGGHLKDAAVDLFLENQSIQWLKTKKIQTDHTHGTGCTFSAAITATLAKGYSLKKAVHTAKKFITKAIATSPRLGHGCGPLNYHA